MPDIVLGIIQPEVLQVLCCLRCILEATEEDYIVLEISHSMAAASRRSLPLNFYT